jgi:uncharacterized membrane protein
MRQRLIAVALFCLLFPISAPAEEAPPGIKGFYLLTDYPAATIRPGTTSTISLRLHNYALPPERLSLTVNGVPTGWTATLLGGGQPVAAAMPATNSSVSLDLRLDVPKDAKVGSQTLTVAAQGGDTKVELPLAMSLATELPAKLSLQPQLPELRGSSKSSFDYQLTLKNDSGKRLVISLGSTAPQNFDATFTELYGSQELSAIPVDAGQSKDVKLKVRPPSTVKAGRYEVTVQASAEDAKASAKLALNITGQPKLELSGREGLLSARASAGTEASIPIVVTNSGTAPAEQIQLSGSAPSGWKVSFDPKMIDAIAPGEQREVQALVTPVSKAIAGDYATTLRADARGESASQTFRVAVTTSTVWGVAGFGIIGAALLVLVGAVARFGRR